MGSIEKVVINLGETCKETRKKTKFTPSSPIKATPSDVTYLRNDVADDDHLRKTSDDDDYLRDYLRKTSDDEDYLSKDLGKTSDDEDYLSDDVTDDVMMTSSTQNESKKGKPQYFS